MCGIIAMFNFEQNKNNVNENVIAQYEDQHSRGADGFGIIFINEDGTYKVERATEPVKMMVDLNLTPSKSIIMHHRNPTSTDNTMDQTHPILVSNGSLKYDYLIVHNGIVTNDDDLKKSHEELGFTYQTEYTEESKYNLEYEYERFNDSEAAAIEISRFIEDQIKVLNIKGSVAFVAAQVDKTTKKIVKIFYGKDKTSSLNFAKSRGKVRISSEGEGESVKELTLYSFNLTDYKIEKKPMIFEFDYKVATPTPAPIAVPITTPASQMTSIAPKFSAINNDMDEYEIEEKIDNGIEAIGIITEELSSQLRDTKAAFAVDRDGLINQIIIAINKLCNDVEYARANSKRIEMMETEKQYASLPY